MSQKIAIIGAGIAGATAARILADAGHEIVVFEKSGGTGGRLSTRRTEFGTFDHGAQYITAKGAPFRAMMTGLSKVGAVAYWEPDGKNKTTTHEWHVGTPGMSTLVKPLLDAIDVRLRTRITEISRVGDEVNCVDEDGKAERFERVIVAVPSPQAHELLAPVDDVFALLNTIIYMPCWTAMFAFESRVGSLPDIHRGEDSDAVAWLARNNTKPERAGVEMLCVQAGGLWSNAHLVWDQTDALAAIKAALESMAGTTLNPIYAQAHRWRYARVDKPLGTAFLASRDARLFAIGDGMLGGRVEASFESARQLCDHLKATFK
ncbi:MAG: FAD-dependent oxidoreductase [Ahrensia sp.]|nr:FAD-dependent oxidoreductase [Ahrensia sp.]